MKRLLVLLIAAALALTACSSGGSGNTFTFRSATKLGHLYPESGRKKPGDFTGTLLNGTKTSLGSDAGKVVVVNFWGTWCQPCATETPQFDLVYRAVKAKGVGFFGIDVKDIKSHAESFVKNNNISYPIIFDEQNEAALHMGDLPAIALPFTVLLDRQGRVAAVYVGRMTAKDLTGSIDKLLAER
jgi:peroxiredoxin